MLLSKSVNAVSLQPGETTEVTPWLQHSDPQIYLYFTSYHKPVSPSKGGFLAFSQKYQSNVFNTIVSYALKE